MDGKFYQFMDDAVEAVLLVLAIPFMLLAMIAITLILPFYIPVYLYRKRKGLLNEEEPV